MDSVSQNNQSPVKSIMMIDNGPIRQGPIDLARSWLQKIEEVEQAVQKFHTVDIKLFSSWSHAILDPLAQQCEEKRLEFLKLLDRHDFLVSSADQMQVTLPRAFLILREEEKRYQEGDEKVRAEIEKLRQERLKFHEDSLREALNEEEDDDEFENSKSYSSKQNYKRKHEDPEQLNFFNLRSSTDPNEESRVRAKHLYRKIVRLIHPDHLKMDDSRHLKTWFDLIWQKLAVAHQNADLEKLTQIHHKVIIALDLTDELSIAEIKEASKSLELEYKEILSQNSSLKKHPAWNFSKLKNFLPLKNKIKKPYLEKQRFLNENIEELIETLDQIEAMANRLQTKNFQRQQRSRSLRQRSR